MATSGSALTAAANAVKDAQKFSDSVGKQSGHEYSHAPYMMAKKESDAMKASAPKGLGAELAVKANNIKEYNEATK